MKTPFLLCTLILGYTLHAQVNSDTIKWTNNAQKLTWQDFQALPDAVSPFSAVSNCNIDCTYETDDNGILQFEVICYFLKSKSWKKQAVLSNELLSHEVGHFDISRIFAQKIHIALNAISHNDNLSIEFIDLTIRNLQDECSALQIKYDEETDHGKSLLKQQSWKNLIDKTLKDLGVTK